MKFSVILPLHNASPYMRVMLESIRDQTYHDYDLICVCDACIDDTERIAREYTDIVIPTDFRRAGLARNKGLETATGEWILFADDDDWLPDDGVFQWWADNVGRHGEDILMAAFDWLGIGVTRQTTKVHYSAVWDKAWRREFVGETRFSEKRYGDDADFDNAMFAKGPKVWTEDRVVYVYNYMRPGSLTEKVKTGKMEA